MIIDNSTVVTMTYTLSVIHADGNIEFIEKRGPEDPLEFLCGRNILLLKVETALAGKTAGFSCQLKLKPEEAYGLRDEKLVSTYPIAKLPKGSQPKKGMKYQTQGPTGDVISVIVTNVDSEKVTLDGNHPLADAFIQFDIVVVKVRVATSEELRTGVVVPSLLH